MTVRKKTTVVEKDVDVKPRVLSVMIGGTEQRVTVPGNARLTFGPTIPFESTRGNGYNGQPHRGYSLRVYATSKNDSLIAVFAGVESFRDITIQVEKLIVRESGKTVWKSDETGFKVEEEVKREKSWDNLNLLAD